MASTWPPVALALHIIIVSYVLDNVYVCMQQGFLKFTKSCCHFSYSTLLYSVSSTVVFFFFGRVLYVCVFLYSSEVIGALLSVLIIWLLTGVLVYEAILRLIHPDYHIDADVMLITACVGVFVNVL